MRAPAPFHRFTVPHRLLRSAFALVLAVPLGVWAQAVGPDREPRNGSGFDVSVSLGDLLRGAAALARAVNRQGDEAYESGQLLVLWPDTQQATQGLAELANRERLRPAARVVLDALGADLAVFQFASQTEAGHWRSRLRSSYPDWIIDFNARAELLQSRPLDDGELLSAAVGAPASVPAGQARLYARRMLGLLPLPPVRSGESLRVGVIDTGIDARLLSPDVQSRVWNGSRFVQRSLLAPDDLPATTTHGTAVAQLLAGSIIPGTDFAGAAPPGTLWWATAFRQTSERQSTHTVLLAQSLDWLLGESVQLISLSAGGAGDDILKAVVSKVLQRDVTLIAAAGNRPDAQPVYPAAYPGVWAVGAVDAARQRYAQGSRGSYLGFAAPGVDVWGPDAEGLAARPVGVGTAGRYMSGSSFAAAFASGTLAWMPSSFWALTRSARLEQVCLTAHALDATQGCGLVQLGR